MHKLFDWLRSIIQRYTKPKPLPVRLSWIDSLLYRVQMITPKSLYAYNAIRHGEFEIETHFVNVELLLDAITDLAIAIDNSTPMPTWVDSAITPASVTIDEWLVTNHNHSVLMYNLKEVLEEKLMNYKRVLDGLTEPTKRSYYMRVTIEINRDIETLVDLITHNWEKHETKTF